MVCMPLSDSQLHLPPTKQRDVITVFLFQRENLSTRKKSVFMSDKPANILILELDLEMMSLS